MLEKKKVIMKVRKQMTSCFDKPRDRAYWRSVDIGHAIHMEVVAEGQREGVWAYLYHDGRGNAWFEKCKKAVFRDGVLVEKSGVPYRRFSTALAAKMRQHKNDLRVYARWYESGSSRQGVGVKMRREVAAARCAALVDGQIAGAITNGVVNNTPPPVVGSEANEKSQCCNGKGERH